MHCPALVTFIQDKEPKYWTVPLNTRHLATLFVTLIQEMLKLKTWMEEPL